MSSGNALLTISKCLPYANAWIQTLFNDCIYTTWDMVAFFIGLSSVAFWIFAQVPQFVSNFARQSADALSPWFLLQWLAGDSFNLLGCLLTGDQLATETITAAYFIFADCAILSQYLYYGHKGRVKPSEACGSDSDESLHKPQNGYYEALQRGTASQVESVLDELTVATCQKATVRGMNAKEDLHHGVTFGSHLQLPHGQSFADESESGEAQELVDRAQSRKGVTAAIDPSAECKRRPKECACFAGGWTHSQQSNSNYNRKPVIGSHHRHGRKCCFGNAKCVHLHRVVMKYGLECGSFKPNTRRHMLISSGKKIGLPAYRNQHFQGSVKAVFCLTGLLSLGSLSWMSSMGIHAGFSPTLQNSLLNAENHVFVLGRRGLQEFVYPEDTGFPHRRLLSTELFWTRRIGLVLGWISSALYLGSRLSQLLKNRSRKSVEGLSLCMVSCAIMANLTYGLAILMRITSWGDSLGKAPWLIGSLGTVSLDLTILIQAYYLSYRYGTISKDECSRLLSC